MSVSSVLLISYTSSSILGEEENLKGEEDVDPRRLQNRNRNRNRNRGRYDDGIMGIEDIIVDLWTTVEEASQAQTPLVAVDCHGAHQEKFIPIHITASYGNVGCLIKCRRNLGS